MLSHFFRKLRPRAAEPLETIRADGVVWHLREDAAGIFGRVPDLAAWRRDGLLRLVKGNLQRSIWRVVLPGGTIFIKRCRANTPRSWAREILRPPKARLEFENALLMQSKGIGCVEPLAWGASDGRWPGDSFVVTREVPDAVPLDAFFGGPLTSERRRNVAIAFGRFVADLHGAGFLHPDPHPGNFLISWSDGGPPRFVLLDVHAVVKVAGRRGDLSLGNLVLLNRWFQLRASRTDRARFWRAYLGPKSETPAAIGDARRVERMTRESNLRFWANRLGRYSGNNREYRKIGGVGVRGHAVRDLPEELLTRWRNDPDAIFADPESILLKDSPSSTVAAASHGGIRYVFKRFRRKGIATGIKNRLRASPALRSWIAGQSLRDRGLPTARPLAVLHRYRGGLPREGYLIFEFAIGAVELPEAVGAASGEGRWRLIGDLARLIRDMHDRGVSHRDLKAANILIADGRPLLIDLVGVRLGLAVSDRERVRNLARLNASFVTSECVNRADRLRFLKVYLVYLSWSGRESRDWKALWRAIAVETSVKIEKNRRSGRVLA